MLAKLLFKMHELCDVLRLCKKQDCSSHVTVTASHAFSQRSVIANSNRQRNP